MNEIKNRLAAMTVDQLSEVVASLSRDMRDEADVVFSAALEVLEGKMPEADFVRFCDKL